MSSRILAAATLASVVLSLSGCGQPDVSYQQHIQPILDRHCAECHTGTGPGVEASGFRTDSYANVMTGTRFGPMVEPGDPLSSSLYRLVAGEVHPSIRMPHGQQQLSADEISLIREWIRQGARNN
jgi:mono/diheme cytochrome c family protein